MVMVKAFGYGNGGLEISKLLHHNVDYLGVAFADEGISLKNGGYSFTNYGPESGEY
jgi:alanine racemase